MTDPLTDPLTDRGLLGDAIASEKIRFCMIYTSYSKTKTKQENVRKKFVKIY